MPEQIMNKKQYVGEVDAVSEGFVTIDFPHHEIHDGDHYYIEGFTALGSEDTLYVKLVTPNTTTWSHLTWNIESNGILETNLYEGVSGGMGGGTNKVPLNSNRNSTNTSVLTITQGVQLGSDLGTTISSKKVGGTGFKSTTGGASIREDEIILKQNTTYLREFKASSDANIVSFRANWYEHKNKN